MSVLEVWTTIVGMALIVFAARYVPMAMLERFRLPAWAQQALRFVPAATLAGLVLPALLTDHGRWVGLGRAELWAGALAALLAWRFKNALLTMVVGLLGLALLRLVFGF